MLSSRLSRVMKLRDNFFQNYEIKMKKKDIIICLLDALSDLNVGKIEICESHWVFVDRRDCISTATSCINFDMMLLLIDSNTYTSSSS